MRPNRQDRQETPPLERRCRLLMFSYPAAYRRERAGEMVSTLLEATPQGRIWPLPRDVMALVIGGLRARSGSPRRLKTAVNLRLAALLGFAVYLSFEGFGGRLDYLYFLPQAWPVLLWSVLLAVTILLALLTRRRAVVAASALVTVAVQLLSPGRVSLQNLLPFVAVLALLVLLSGGAERPPRLWLWLPGAWLAAPWLGTLAAVVHCQRYVIFLMNNELKVLVVLALAVAWIFVDARLAFAMASCVGVAFIAATIRDTIISSGYMLHSLQPQGAVWWEALVVAVGLGAPAIFLVRRQAAL